MVCGAMMFGAVLAVAAPDVTAAFTDPNFLGSVREKIGKPTGPTMDTDVEDIQYLYVDTACTAVRLVLA